MMKTKKILIKALALLMILIAGGVLVWPLINRWHYYRQHETEQKGRHADGVYLLVRSYRLNEGTWPASLKDVNWHSTRLEELLRTGAVRCYTKSNDIDSLIVQHRVDQGIIVRDSAGLRYYDARIPDGELPGWSQISWGDE